MQTVADFAMKVYRGKDFTGFKGDKVFVESENAQKAFSKLRASIAGVYAWRLGLMKSIPTDAQFQPASEADRQKLIKEADFAYRQAFALCPYSPEAVFRYADFLVGQNRIADALLVARTSHRIAPGDAMTSSLVQQLEKTAPAK